MLRCRYQSEVDFDGEHREWNKMHVVHSDVILQCGGDEVAENSVGMLRSDLFLQIVTDRLEKKQNSETCLGLLNPFDMGVRLLCVGVLGLTREEGGVPEYCRC